MQGSKSEAEKKVGTSELIDWFRVLVRRFTRHSIPVSDGKGYKGDLWVNDLPGGENQRGQEHVAGKWNGIEDV
jgi:hypothetical protein